MADKPNKPDREYAWEEVESLYITTDMSLND